jgi:hypothetical protein
MDWAGLGAVLGAWLRAGVFWPLGWSGLWTGQRAGLGWALGTSGKGLGPRVG